MIASIRLLVFGCVTGFFYALLSSALRPLPNINSLDAIGLGFALGLSALVWFAIAALIVATAGFSIAILSAFSPVVIGLASVARAALKPTTRMSQRERIARLYPLPDPRRLILHE